MELLLGSATLKIFRFLALVLETLLPFRLLTLLALEVKLLVGLLGGAQQCRFSLLEIILKHATHPIELVRLLVVHLLFQLLLLCALPLLLDLLVQPLLLLVLKELPPRVILCIRRHLLRS